MRPPCHLPTQCGSCWAFAATAALESYYLIAGGQEVWDLSEQQLVDCVSPNYGYASNGCEGGYYLDAFTFMSKVVGVGRPGA